jgi:UrcA family protein
MSWNFIVAAIAATCLVAPASVQVALPSLVVRVADLDLSRTRDLRRLDRRISRAAATVCQPESQLDLEGINSALQCRRDTLAASRQLRDHAVALFSAKAHLAAETGKYLSRN